MYLIEIDVVCSQPLQTIFTLLNNTCTTCILINVDVFALVILAFEGEFSFSEIPSHSEFGKDLKFVARNISYKRLSYDFLASALTINGRCIKRSHTQIVGSTNGVHGVKSIRATPHPTACCPRSEGNRRQFQIRTSYFSILHN